jgi:hypothetical protein
VNTAVTGASDARWFVDKSQKQVVDWLAREFFADTAG